MGPSHTTEGAGHILLITCMTTRAIYLEFCGNLEAVTFILALQRFSATHGTPSLSVSDNHQTFRSANHFLQGLYEEDNVQEFLQTGIQWHFQMPQAPWKGGFFERLIRIAKRMLEVAFQKKSFPEEHVRTLVKEAKGVVNNRPLMYTGDGHDSRPRKRTDLRPGDIVLVKIEQCKRAVWPLGKIMEVYPDDDGVIRSAKVLYNGTETLRAISHLVPLEITFTEDDDQEEDNDEDATWDEAEAVEDSEDGMDCIDNVSFTDH
ncbi:uncharacterized protein LOC135205195 [Macrobrachium nipponense]|uniref:uncharacterized protein LOC135205195 n=1 Tax=Macrobrachium nipponense TaxID=159736 RepID=UPI0030C7A4C5